VGLSFIYFGCMTSNTTYCQYTKYMIYFSHEVKENTENQKGIV